VSGHLIRRLNKKKIPVGLLRFLGNMWFPFLGSGIDIVKASDDFRSITVRLKKRWYNTNYVGTQFGGSIYSMTDPFYMLMLVNNLGSDYIVWDKAASIRFKKPGRTDLYTKFKITQNEIDSIKSDLRDVEKIDWIKDVEVMDSEGNVVAVVNKTLYIKKK